jgi:hypothetical protein
MKLYTNGDLVFVTHHNSVKLRIAKWPNLRGLHHDYEKERRVEMSLAEDKWDFTYSEAWRTK